MRPLMQRPISSLLPILSKTSIDNDYLLRNQKSRRSYPLQLRPFMADNFEIKIPHLSTLPHRNLTKETCRHSEARRAKETGGKRNRAMTFNDDVLTGKYGDGVCDICNYHHNIIIIELESGNHIRTKPLRKDKTTIAKTRPGLTSFWEAD
jgi:hypothetical protein